MCLRSPIFSSCLVMFLLAVSNPCRAEDDLPEAKVVRCEDFQVGGEGSAAAWEKAEWVKLNRRPGANHDYTARFKMMHSKTGVYVLFDGTDKKLTATLEGDFLNLWTEDVFECFFWTDERHPVYFEYEISPLGYELPILVPNLDGKYRGWAPWNYEGDRKVKKHVAIAGEAQKPGAAITNWQAEVFIPYALLVPLQNVPPKPGSKWRANFYRVDYDDKKATSWDWARVGPSFHEYQKFGRLVFE